MGRIVVEDHDWTEALEIRIPWSDVNGRHGVADVEVGKDFNTQRLFFRINGVPAGEVMLESLVDHAEDTQTVWIPVRK